ncbi:unnamed protein product (mitochondrion) [Plasmodiophora brassicae]|uniref:Uncharacterized protein n=1 Tax=Plasmodiophora brassicae TaxID=37360 RepID=A0A3P3YFT5_PLABS|nr:unnamed protein product [Plasmodiophora brassicae]
MVLPVEQIDRAAIWSLMLSHRSIVVDRTSPTNVPIVAMLENIGLQPAPWRSHISETAAGSVAPTYGLLQSGQSAPLIITIPPEAAYLSATSLVQVYSTRPGITTARRVLPDLGGEDIMLIAVSVLVRAAASSHALTLQPADGRRNACTVLVFYIEPSCLLRNILQMRVWSYWTNAQPDAFASVPMLVTDVDNVEATSA